MVEKAFFYELCRRPLFRAANVGRTRFLWHQSPVVVPPLPWNVFDMVFNVWVPVEDPESLSSTIKKRLVHDDRLVPTFDEAVGHPAAVFQEVRALTLSPALMSWCSFEDKAASRWQGCVGCLDKNLQSLKCLSEVVVVFQYCEAWATETKVLAFVSTVQHTGARYKCAQVFDEACPPYGFDEQGNCRPQAEKLFDHELKGAKDILRARHIETEAKKNEAEARALARNNKKLDEEAAKPKPAPAGNQAEEADE